MLPPFLQHIQYRAVASAAVLCPGSAAAVPRDVDDAAAADEAGAAGADVHFVTSDARRFIRSVVGTGGDVHSGIDAGGSGGCSCLRQAHAHAFALAHASVIVLAGLQREKDGAQQQQQQQQRARVQALAREVACVDAVLTEEWRRHIRSAQLEAGAADGGAAAGWCEAARAMRWFALPFDGLRLKRGGEEASVEEAWGNCVWAKILHSREHDSSSFALNEEEWKSSMWATMLMQHQDIEQAGDVQQGHHLQLKRDATTREQSAIIIHASTNPAPQSKDSSAYTQFLTQNLQRLVPLHPRATFFELCRITGALWNSTASASLESSVVSPSSSSSDNALVPSPVLPSGSNSIGSSAVFNDTASCISTDCSAADAAVLVQPLHPRDWLIKPAVIARQGAADTSSSSSSSDAVGDDGAASSSTFRTSLEHAPSARLPNPALSIKATQLLGSKIRKLMTKASTEFDMIKEGDRVLVGLSGGKDSLTMLVLLLDLQRRAPFKFSVAACTVEPGAAEFDPSPLKAYVTPQLGIPYFFESDTIIQRAKGVGGKFSICAYCARQKRGILYSTALREGYNVLALAQHTDDLAESFLMSAMHNGRLRTMKVTARSLIWPRWLYCYAIGINVLTGQLHQRQGRARHSPSYVRHLTLCCNNCDARSISLHVQLCAGDDDPRLR